MKLIQFHDSLTNTICAVLPFFFMETLLSRGTIGYIIMKNNIENCRKWNIWKLDSMASLGYFDYVHCGFSHLETWIQVNDRLRVSIDDLFIKRCNFYFEFPPVLFEAFKNVLLQSALAFSAISVKSGD